jgi:hypothetical protein
VIDLGTVNMELCLRVPRYYHNYEANSSNLFAGPDDDSCVLFTNYAYINNVAGYPADIWVIDASGAYTWYTMPLENETISGILPFGRNNFLVTFASTGNSYWFTPVNAKLNNSSPIVLFPSSGVGDVCGQNFHNLFYDPIKNILIAGYYYPAGQNGAFINSVAYKVGANGYLAPLASGYAGYADPPDTPDPFNQTQNGTATGISITWIQTNGVNSGFGVPQANEIVLSRSSLSVNPGANQGILCPNQSGFPPNPSGANVQTITSQYVAMPAPVQPWYTVDNIWPSDTSIPGLELVNSWVTSQSNGPLIAYGDGAFFFCLFNYVPNPYWSQMQSCALTKKYLFGQYFAGNQGGTSYTVISIAANPGILNGTTAVPKPISVCVNNSRPISVTGAYRS